MGFTNHLFSSFSCISLCTYTVIRSYKLQPTERDSILCHISCGLNLLALLAGSDSCCHSEPEYNIPSRYEMDLLKRLIILAVWGAGGAGWQYGYLYAFSLLRGPYHILHLIGALS